MSRQPGGLPARVFSGLVGLLLFVPLATSYAQKPTPTGEEVYVDRLGCWNCHGKTGEGGGGAGAGAALIKAKRSLRSFVSYIRLPAKEMPPFATVMGTDDDLAIAYRWLQGSEEFKAPLPISLDLKRSAPPKAGAPETQIGVELTALVAETSTPAATPPVASLGYRVTLTSDTDAPVANQAFEYQPAGKTAWTKFTTDAAGEALLGPASGIVVAKAVGPKTLARLRIAGLPAGKTALVVEALDLKGPTAVGIGSLVLRVQ